MKIRTYGKQLNSSQARVTSLTFSAETDEERDILARLYEGYMSGNLSHILGEEIDMEIEQANGLDITGGREDDRAHIRN